jgi:hypothetical protein
MAITFVSSASNLGNSITSFPTHEKNDLLLFLAYNDGASTAVTRPTGWIARVGLGLGAAGFMLVAYQVAQNSSTTSGTWTNADAVMVMVFRPGLDETIGVNYISTISATSATHSYGVQVTGTFETGAPDQAFIGLVANRSNTNTLLPPGTMTNAQYITDTTFGIAGHYQLSRSTAWTAQTVTEASSVIYRTIVLGLTAVSNSIDSGPLISSASASNLIG